LVGLGFSSGSDSARLGHRIKIIGRRGRRLLVLLRAVAGIRGDQ